MLLFVIVLLAGNAMRDTVDWLAAGRITFRDIFAMLWVLLPSAISYALPIGMASGILIAMGKMSSRNEILAMKSSAMSLWEITLPIWILASICTLLATYVNLYHAPDAISKYRQHFGEIVRDNPMRFIAPKTFNRYFPEYVIYVDDIVNGEFSGMKIWQLGEDGSLDAHITARSGTIAFHGDRGMFSLNLSGGSAEKFNGAGGNSTASQMVFFGNVSLDLPSADITSGGERSAQKKLHRMTLGELLAEKKLLDSRSSGASPSQIRHEKMQINMQINCNIAGAVSILAMAALAIPLAIGIRRSDTALNVGIALLFSLGYYFATAMILTFGSGIRIRGDILIWAPCAATGAIGIFLFRRAALH
jgi:lipopolysaccharide export system permease protein